MPIEPRTPAPFESTPLGADPQSGPLPYTDGLLELPDGPEGAFPFPGRRPRVPAAAPQAGQDKSGQARPRDEASQLWVETVTDWAQLASLEAEWDELAAAAIEPNAFYEPWMLLPALRAFARKGRIEVALVFGPHPTRAKGKRQLCGLFPLRFHHGRVELWRHSYCYLTTPLLRDGAAPGALSRFLDWLAERCPLVRLEDAPGDGQFRLLLVDELMRRRWPSVLSQSYTRAVMRRAGSAEEFLERALPGKRRKELRRQRTRLGEIGRLELRELPSSDDPRPWIAHFLQLEASGWKGRKGVAAAARAGDAEFMGEMAVAGARRGRLQMLGLHLDGKPIALKLNLLGGEGAFAFKIAFDESFARFSPGVQLEIDNVQRAHERPGLRWMDSCAAPNRFMINHLWPDRREMQTVFFATGGAWAGLKVALVPLVHFLRSHAPFRRRP